MSKKERDFYKWFAPKNPVVNPTGGHCTVPPFKSKRPISCPPGLGSNVAASQMNTSRAQEPAARRRSSELNAS